MPPDFSSAVDTPPAGPAQPWTEVWLSAVTRPSPETYESLVRRPKATLGRAYLWVCLSALAGTALSIVIQWALAPLVSAVFPNNPSTGGGLGTLVCIPIVTAAFTVLGLTISAGFSHLVARALGGNGTFAQLAYAFAAYIAPLGLVASVLSALPLLVCLTIPLGIYGIVLNIIAVKGVYQLSWGKSAAASVTILALVLIVVAVLVIVILALLGPAIGNVFSNIIQEIGTPVP